MADIDYDQQLMNFDGKPFAEVVATDPATNNGKEFKHIPFTLRKVLLMALNSEPTKERDTMGQKMAKYNLIRKISKRKKPGLLIDDLKLVKDIVGEMILNPFLVGIVTDILEGKTEYSDEDFDIVLESQVAPVQESTAESAA